MVASLGGRTRAQGLAVLTILLLPVAFFEASNAKNDIILSLFVLFPFTAGFRLWLGHFKPDLPLLLTAALAAGLAVATKGTAVVFLLPSAILIAAACLQHRAGRILLLALLPGLMLALLPPLPQMVRNQLLFHSPAGPNLHHGNLSHHPADVLNVAIRNIGGQFTCDSSAWNRRLESTTRILLKELRLNPDDPATTFEGQTFHLPYFAGLEDIVPAQVQTLLLILLPIAFLFPSLRRRPGFIPLFICTYGSLLLFCLIFRWQPWQSRLLIPSYFMAAPLIGVMLDQLRPSWLVLVVTFAELLSLRPHLVYAGQRPLLGGHSIFRMSRDEQMSRMMPGRLQELAELVSELRKAPPSVIQIDGGATEIYGLLRALQIGIPATILHSGSAEHPAEGSPWIIQSTTRDAGVAPPPRDPSPSPPSGYRVFWIGDYYRVFNPVGRPLTP
jgi:4-amino-4-deoxy-L-arabinose transferase-like glycosyltransferase